ncbi:hypothetical protein AUJ17_02040 [Candidatus Micrarchaeota archaeon CG1_02_47_40]|nr:MAG: hypothetical protein AUJ17_02040 [Candidatus Micrarchaeota archaeon CG1_02_47_40]
MGVQKKKKPKFLVPNYGRTSRKKVKLRWRRQRGQDNKKRRKRNNMGAIPHIGYRNTFSVRGQHPCGKMEVLVCNEAMLSGLKGVAIRIGKGVGKRKREGIKKKAGEMSLSVLN